MIKRFVLTFFIFLLSVLPVQSQEKIYLPVIIKGSCDMTSTLKISDGTTTIDLLAGLVGLHLTDWKPAIAGLKEGGVYQDSSIAPGSQLVYGQFANVNEVFNFHLNNFNQDAAIYDLQELLRLLQKARNYWLTQWQDTPVYLIAQSNCETNVRYALIKNYTAPQLTNPYGQPFFSGSSLAGMNDLALGIERGHWCANVPGTGECIEIGSTYNWTYANLFENVDAPAGLVGGGPFLEAPISGDIFTANGVSSPQFRVSTDDGATWANNFTIASTIVFINSFVDSNGNLYFMGIGGTNQGIWRTADEGATPWVQVQSTEDFGPIAEASNGDLFAFTKTGDAIYTSTNDGVTWTLHLNVVGKTGASSAFTADNGNIIFGGTSGIYLSTDNGVSFTRVYQNGTVFDFSDIQSSNGVLYISAKTAVGIPSAILKSTDNGATWSTHYIFDAASYRYQGAGFIIGNVTGIWYMNILDNITTDGAIVASSNGGVNWFVLAPYDSTATTVAPGDNGDIFETSAGTVLYSADDSSNNEVTWREAGNFIATLGQSATCDNQIPVANKIAQANLTHIKIDDGGVFSDIFPISSYPQALLPAVPAANDAIYFGIDTTVNNSGTFASLVFDIAGVASSTVSYTIDWEYWNGAWVTLSAQDNTIQFSQSGVNTVNWEIPSDWTTTAVDSVTGYWVRATLSALSGTLTPPTQQNRDIYSAVLPYVESASAQVLGDIPALSRMNVTNQSDLDGPGGSAPDLWANRVVAGLRSYDRGNSFQSYVNLSDTQSPNDVVISVGTNSTFTSDITAPTTRMVQYNPGGVEAMATRAAISIGNYVARDFYGTFHAFLRVQRTAGASTDFDVRLQITSGSGGVAKTTDSKQVQTTTAFEVLDFGQIRIPAAGNLSLSELGDTTTINVQASAASGTPNLNLYDLILIPTDEWSIDTVDKANESDSDIGRSNDIQKYLDIDSITVPKYSIRANVKEVITDRVTSIYDAITPQEAILQANAQQRLWFFVMQTSATGTSYSWIAPQEIVHSIQVYKNERYLALRGNR